MRRIYNRLGVGNVMNGRNDAMSNAQAFVHDFHNGRKTVSGAGSRCQQMMLVGIIQIVVNPHHDIKRALFHRCGYNHLLHASLKVGI